MDEFQAFRTFQQTATASAAELLPARGGYRNAIIQNIDDPDTGAAFYVGDSDVTAETGFRLLPGESVGFPAADALYIIEASGAPVANVIEFYHG